MTTDSTTYSVTPTTFAYGGEVIGRLPDGRAVFIPLALPDETVLVRLVEEKRGYARAELLQVAAPSPQRVEPFCAHYGVCGGCHYQHMPYAMQLVTKRAVLKDQLERIGRLQTPPVDETVGCEMETFYRNHIQFHLTAEGKLGYHQERSIKVLPIRECHLPEETLNRIWPQLDFESIPDLERIGLRLGAGDDIQLILESKDPVAPELSVEDLPISVVHLSSAGALVMAGSPDVVMQILDRPFRVSAGSFFQVNTAMAEKMVEHLLEHLPNYGKLGPDSVLIEVYCGVGLFSAFLAPQVGRLIGIEASGSAADDFVANLDAFDHVEIYEAPAEIALAHLDVQPDIILVDPPRAGIDRKAMDQLVKLASKTLVYISCDPATLARDARRLISGGYRLEKITPFDLFPQTYHIESISFWVRD